MWRLLLQQAPLSPDGIRSGLRLLLWRSRLLRLLNLRVCCRWWYVGFRVSFFCSRTRRAPNRQRAQRQTAKMARSTKGKVTLCDATSRVTPPLSLALSQPSARTAATPYAPADGGQKNKGSHTGRNQSPGCPNHGLSPESHHPDLRSHMPRSPLCRLFFSHCPQSWPAGCVLRLPSRLSAVRAPASNALHPSGGRYGGVQLAASKWRARRFRRRSRP